MPSADDNPPVQKTAKIINLQHSRTLQISKYLRQLVTEKQFTEVIQLAVQHKTDQFILALLNSRDGLAVLTENLQADGLAYLKYFLCRPEQPLFETQAHRIIQKLINQASPKQLELIVNSFHAELLSKVLLTAFKSRPTLTITDPLIAVLLDCDDLQKKELIYALAEQNPEWNALQTRSILMHIAKKQDVPLTQKLHQIQVNKLQRQTPLSQQLSKTRQSL
jgi:hypothetical protein